MKNLDVKSAIPDVPRDGPLQVYRERATFDWKSLKLNLYGSSTLEFQYKLFSFMASRPEFARSTKRLTLDEERRQCIRQVNLLHQNDFIDYNASYTNYFIMYDGSLPVIAGVPYLMVPGTIFSLGTERHYEIMSKLREGHLRGCFALTEVAHGTNVKGMRTTATYDVESQSFIINSPDFEAAKFWIGALGKQATHAVVFAQLITPDGVKHGLHVFIVPVRDPRTMLPLPNVTVGDLGDKVGLNGADNGFIMFHNVKVPRESLLNKMSDVTPDGRYVSPIKDESRRFGASLGALSLGRVNITNISATYCALAIVIAVRYCSVRRQFGPSDTEEWPVIEYPVLHGRLIPWLATAYAVQVFSMTFIRKSQELQARAAGGASQEQLAEEGLEVHALSSAAKPYCSWIVRDAIQECREVCGGMGYLKVARLGSLRADHDANCTYEGENNVLIQQASNWLLGFYRNFQSGQPVVSPMGTVDFLPRGRQILSEKFKCRSVEEALEPQRMIRAFQWLVCYYLEATYRRIEVLKREGKDQFSVRNDSQTFFARSLSLVYAEYAVFKTFVDKLADPELGGGERAVLEKLCSLFGAFVLEKRLGDFYAGGFAERASNMDKYLREGVIKLSRELVDEAVALVDVLAPPDFILNSPLGMSDGRVYEHLERSLRQDKDTFARPEWWREMVPAKL